MKSKTVFFSFSTLTVLQDIEPDLKDQDVGNPAFCLFFSIFN